MVQTNTATDPDGQSQAVKEELLEKAADLKDTAVEHAGAVTREAKGKAIDVAQDVRRELENQGDEQARRLGGALRDTSRQLRDMADGAEPGQVGQMTRQLASSAERLAGRLEDGGLQGVGDDLRNFARRQPGMFLLATGVAGFVATRVLRNASGTRPSDAADASSPAPASWGGTP
jgi:hypothetical protein